MFNKLFLYKQLLLIWLFFIFKVKLINVVIKNDKDTMDTFAETINNISNAYESSEINIILEDDYYPIATYNRNIFNVKSSLIFHGDANGKSGTVFDFQHSPKSTINFIFQQDLSFKKIVFKNITFQRYYNSEPFTYMMFFTITTEINNFQVIFEHCTFFDIHGLSLYIRHSGLSSNDSSIPESHMIFNHCKFM